MKKWVILGAVLICCLLFALVRLSKPQDQNEQIKLDNATIETQANTDNADKAPLVEDSDSAVPADQVEAVTKAFEKFQSCLKDEDYQQAWELTSENFRQIVCEGDFEEFKETCFQMKMATATIHPDSGVVMDDGVGLLVTSPSFEEDLYFFFVEEDGQWRLNKGQEARDVPQ